MKIFVDTNVFLRFLLADHPSQSPACRRLFEKAKEGKIKLFTHPVIILEIAWVLLSYYKESKKQVTDKLRLLLFFKEMEIPERQILLDAIALFEEENLDLTDAFMAVWLKSKKSPQIYSFDRDFDHVEGLKRLTPE